MIIKTTEISVEKSAEDLGASDITDKVQQAVGESGALEGSATVFVSGSTASITTMEYDLNLFRDLRAALERITPSEVYYEHHKTLGDYNGKSHIHAALVGPSLTVPFSKGNLVLGIWQRIVVMDFDISKKDRRIIVQVMGE